MASTADVVAILIELERRLIERPCSQLELSTDLQIDVRTLKRYLAVLRKLGSKIENKAVRVSEPENPLVHHRFYTSYAAGQRQIFNHDKRESEPNGIKSKAKGTLAKRKASKR